MKKYFALLSISAITISPLSLAFAQDADAPQYQQENDIDHSEDQIIERTLEVGDGLAKKIEGGLENEATRDLSAIKGELGNKNEDTSQVAEAQAPTINNQVDDSNESIEKDIQKLEGDAKALSKETTK